MEANPVVPDTQEYGVEDIMGIRYGFRGFFEQGNELQKPIKVKAVQVEHIRLTPRVESVWFQPLESTHPFQIHWFQSIAFLKYATHHPPPYIKLTTMSVDTIHLEGGSVLGSSRGGSDTGEIVTQIKEMGRETIWRRVDNIPPFFFKSL